VGLERRKEVDIDVLVQSAVSLVPPHVRLDRIALTG
jgi:hypothetical protein